MNKRECIEVIKHKLNEMYANYSGPSDFDKRRETYAECKELCLQNGYEGKAFEDLWNKACFEHYSVSKQ